MDNDCILRYCRKALLITLATMLCHSPACWAATMAASSEQLLATGQAVIINNDQEQAFMNAVLDALHQLSSQQKSHLISHSLVDQQGQLEESVLLQTSLAIESLDIIKRDLLGDMARVQIAVTLQQTPTECRPGKLNRVISAQLLPPTGPQQSQHIDINRLLVLSGEKLQKMVVSEGFHWLPKKAPRNDYQQAYLADAYHFNNDYELELSVTWQDSETNLSKPNNLLSKISMLTKPNHRSQPSFSLHLSITSAFDATLTFQASRQFTLNNHGSVAENLSPTPAALMSEIDHWLQQSWHQGHGKLKCHPTFVDLRQEKGSEFWVVNKGQLHGLHNGQKILLLPPYNEWRQLDTSQGPQIYQIQRSSPYSASLQRLAGFSTGRLTRASIIVL